MTGKGTPKMTIRYDHSSTSTLVQCSQCPGWWSFHLNKHRARAAGETHEVDVHDRDQDAASNARRQREYRARRAGRS